MKHFRRELILYVDESGLQDQREAEIIERNGAVVTLRDLETGEEVHRIEQELIPLS